ncbi:MAG: DUF3450 domain-containing protein [Oceanococcaceae bacterium]
MTTGAAVAAMMLMTLGLSTVAAADIDAVENALVDGQRQAAQSQARVDSLDDATRKALNAYRAALLRAEQLRLYQEQLEQQMATQTARLETVEGALARVEDTQAAMVPLLVKMTDALEQFVDADQPFDRTARVERVAALRQTLADPEIGLAEQYRDVFAAWQDEARSGRILKAERVNLPGAPRQQLVDLVQVGRLALYALALDGSAAWQWDAAAGRFAPLATATLPALKQALRVAQEQAAPDLLIIPGAFAVSTEAGS